MSYESELRRTADEFVLTACVLADDQGVADPKKVMLVALTDSLARLRESGAIGPEGEVD